MQSHVRFNTPDDRSASGVRILLIGVWLRAAFAGTFIAAAGLAALIGPAKSISLLTALTWIFAGATFAWLAWQRATKRLDRLDDQKPVRGETVGASPLPPAGRLSASA